MPKVAVAVAGRSTAFRACGRRGGKLR